MTHHLLKEAVAAGRSSLNESQGKALLAEYGLRVPGSVVVQDAGDVAKDLKGMQGPFVVKVMSPDILHKSEAGGVSLGLTNSYAVATAIKEMAVKPAIAKSRIDGWLIEEMVPQGQEVVIGGLRDPQFGPMLMVGLGGIFVEILKDVAFGVCPITKADAQQMIESLRGYNILAGARGQFGVNIDTLVELMLKIGGSSGLLMQEIDTISELDLNPVLVSSKDAIAVDARFILDADTAIKPRSSLASLDDPVEQLTPLFEPKTVAVLGASSNQTTIANTFIRRMKDYGFCGKIFPIHPRETEIEGLRAYRDLASTPEPVDYAYVAIGAARVPDALAAAKGNCRIAQVISSGFSEVKSGHDLEAELVDKARGAGVRVLGPNCLGTYSPRGSLTFPVGAPKELGQIGIISQSGGLSTDIIKRGQWRGIRFSGLVTMGNSCDLTPTDLLEFYFDDPQTKAVGLYIEDIKDGRSFFNLLSSSKATKPVVILRGGRSSQGRLAAASHTGALAGDEHAWRALTAQTGAVMVPHVNAFLDTLLALQSFDLKPAAPIHKIALFGNGGGSSVLGTDAFAEVGLDVSPFDKKTFRLLEALGFPAGTSVVNPVDTPVRTLQEKNGWVAGEILDIIYEHAKPQAIAMHLNLAAFVGRGDVDPVGNLLSVVEEIQKKHSGQAHFALALRSDGSPELEDSKRSYKEQARMVKVPIYDEIPEMAAMFANIAHLERQMARKT